MQALSPEKIIVALDTSTPLQAAFWLDALVPPLTHAKIGLELFTACGPSIFDRLARPNLHFFLDLKLHDIPTTVARTIQTLAQHPIKFLTLHASGGLSMLQAAKEATAGTSIRLLAVTVLTSIDEATCQQIYPGTSTTQDQVLRLAELAQKAGLDGLVCSPLEIQALRARFDRTFILVTPGIRASAHEKSTIDDQSRTMPARKALEAGADYLVVGRPLTRAESPRDALAKMLQEP
ncbi:MAG: orotidine-5'-phosphate decarboxylase [Methylacidiphilales bacterium]|nr:orotidine-5'-phosphate decarboxylase [Candidatus Methylacidiphilales bacterium]MDW8349042.1 orotidine-5'-phosphate decarboxylase [Verrucomicrobiae bacterium]